ncbi:MAG: 23S rRNA (uracil(1939)-C(5))-methyltransferase RlmD [Kofleriaceae bacterium]
MKSNRCEVVASELDGSGHGIARSGDGAIHVLDLLPGERAEVAIDHRSPHRAEAWGHVVRRIGSLSSDRVNPACPSFGDCGGCVWQHLAYTAQLLAKQQIVARALAAVPAVRDGRVTIASVRPSPDQLGYRNKGKYVVGRGSNGLVLGAYAPRSHRVVDTLGCRVVAPIVDEVATWVRGAAERAGIIAYDEALADGELRYVIVREAAGDVLIVLVVAPGTARAKLAAVGAAMAKHPAVRGVVMIENGRRDGAIVPTGSAVTVLHGEAQLVEQLAGAAVEVGAGEFVQVNRAQAHAMYARVVELAQVESGQCAVDLFAGLGGIGLGLARAGAQVVAVEIDRDAVTRLNAAAAQAGLALTALAADTNTLSAELRAQLGTAPDVVVVNPPRKGLSPPARDLVVELAARCVIYVSCGPESLGRDLLELANRGWHPDAIEPFDLMPGTGQVETIARLVRAAEVDGDV